MKKHLWSFILILSAAVAARADFEGVLHMKYTTPQGTGAAKTYISKEGMRNDMEMPMGGRTMKMSVIVQRAKPDIVTMLNDEQKTYSEMNVKEMREHAAKTEQSYTVKDLGKETLLGYSCRHILITHSRGGESELWTTREIVDYESYARARGGEGKDGEGAAFLKALKDAGADGFPVKSIHRGAKKSGAEIVMELVKAEKKALSKDLFQVPAGYKKSEGLGGAAMSPEAQKAMQEQMKNMTPDKKKMLEEMLKGRLKR